MPCSRCYCDIAFASRRRGFLERTVFPKLRLYPFRCPSCSRRFYKWLPSGETEVLAAPRAAVLARPTESMSVSQNGAG